MTDQASTIQQEPGLANAIFLGNIVLKHIGKENITIEKYELILNEFRQACSSKRAETCSSEAPCEESCDNKTEA